MLRSTRVHPTERRVTSSADELKHNHSLTFDSFVISFATAEDIKSFEAEFEITANEPIDPITGTVAFEVVCGDD